jgi:hypothetical protein
MREGPLKRLTSMLLLAAAAPLTAAADEVYLKSGGQLSGRIVSRSESAIEVDIGAGVIGVPLSSVQRIEEGRSKLHEYDDRAGRLAPGDVDGWVALGEWASAAGLSSQARDAYRRALLAAPGDPRANAALGNQQVDGRWVSEEEGYRARGFVLFEGDWITPAEHQAILRERAADDTRERERREAQTRVREAEARAAEAEARAREAEAQAQPQLEGLPLWYGWGAGPVNWPRGPVVEWPIPPVRPVVPRPAPRNVP